MLWKILLGKVKISGGLKNKDKLNNTSMVKHRYFAATPMNCRV
jgi:hypothetical protein